MFKTLILVITLLFMPLAMADDMVVFGEIKENLDAGASFDLTSATHPSMLYYDFEEGYGRETLSFDVNTDLEIVDTTFSYTTQIYPKNGEDYISWLGNPYYVVESGSDWYLGQLLTDEDEGDSHSLDVGARMTLADGYTLVAQEIDVDGEEVMFTLSKGNDTITTEMATEGNWFIYEEDLNDNGNKDNFVVKFYIELIFNGMETDIVEINSLQVVSTDVLHLDLPDNDMFSDYHITSPDDQTIEIELEENVDLKKGGTVDILGGRFEFKVNDDGDVGGVVKIIDLEGYSSDCPDCPSCPECPQCPDVNFTPEDCPECPSCPDCPPCPDCPEITQPTPSAGDASTSSETSETSDDPIIPGFEVLFSLAGILGVAYLIRKKD